MPRAEPARPGGTASLAGALERLCATTAPRHRLAVRFQSPARPPRCPPPHEVALLRIAQSALANTVRHAGAGRAELTLSYMDTEVALDVVDDGRGLRPRRGARPRLRGGPRHRLRPRRDARPGPRRSAAPSSSSPHPGEGTAVAVTLPCPATASAAAPDRPDPRPAPPEAAS